MNWEFMQMTHHALGFGDIQKVYEPNWFATRNFHGQWYSDSDELEKYLHFRSGTLQDFLEEMKAKAPFSTKFAKFLPKRFLKNVVFKKEAEKPFGTLHWIKSNNEQRISAFFGSKEKWEMIPSWDNFKLEKASREPVKLDHGYIESKPKSELEIGDMRKAAEFRGGKCLSEKMPAGKLKVKIKVGMCFWASI